MLNKSLALDLKSITKTKTYDKDFHTMAHNFLLIGALLCLPCFCFASYQESFLKARAHYLAGEHVQAKSIFDTLEKQAPLDFRVHHFQTQIENELERQHENYRPMARTAMLQEVSQAWERPQALEKENQETPEELASEELLAKLKQITIPKLHVVEVPLSRVVEMLSELAVEQNTSREGVNIVLVDPDQLDPKITITLRNIGLDKVLEWVTKSVGFFYDLEDGMVVIRSPKGDESNLKTEFFPVSRATVIRLTGQRGLNQKEELKDSHTQPVLPLAEEEALLRQFFQRAGVDFERSQNSALAFEGSQLIVTQSPRNLNRVRNILKRFQETKQVEIEAKFLEVQQGVLDEFGFRLGISRGNSYVAQTGNGSVDNLRTLSQAFATQNFSSGDGSLIPSVVNPSTGAIAVGDAMVIPNREPGIPNAMNLAAKSVAAAGVLSVLGNWQLEVLVRALEQHSGSDLMSAPKLTVLSGKTADIVVAQELRYPESYGRIQSEVGTGNNSGGGSAGVTITAGTPQDFQVRNIGVEMEVTPTVEEDNSISLRLEPRVTEFEGFVEYGGMSLAITGQSSARIPSGFFQPIFSTRQIRTEVTIFDGATVVMGGLTREQVKEVHDKVPVLGDIPLLGRLFRSRGESSQKRNLLIFVTANLISPGGAPSSSNGRAYSSETLFQAPVVVTPEGATPRTVE